MFVGQRKDSFVVNLGEIFDLVNVTNPLGAENAEADDLADKNVTSFVLEVPIALPRPVAEPADHRRMDDGQPWRGHAERTGTGSSCPPGQPGARRPTDGPGLVWVPDQSCSGWVPSNHPAARGRGRGTPPPPAEGTQVSRLGAPLVNEVVIGLKDKDLFNSARPTQDSALASYVTNPTLPELLEILFGGGRRQGAEQLPAQRSRGGVPRPASKASIGRRASSRRRCSG